MSSKDGPRVQQLAVRFLAHWADCSIINCGKIAVMKGGPALAAALTEADARGLTSMQHHLLHAMAILARDCPLRWGAFG